MKKLNYLMLGLAGLMMASCSQEDLQVPGQADGKYIVTVKLPADLGTRAINMNTGYTANDLYYAVYDAEDNSLVQWNQTKFTEAAGGALETQVGFNLATGKSYKISFFACAPDNKVYTFDANAKTMTVNYEEMTSAGTEENDIYDCFINLLETNEIGSDQMQASVTLYRPIAQINWGTSDLDEPSIKKAYGVDGQYILSNLSTDAYYTWDLLANDVDMGAGTVHVKFKDDFFTQPKSATGLASFPVTGYKYVAMQYVLAPKTEAIYDLNLNITNEGDGNPDLSTLSSDVEVSSAPVQANYQTNIYGSLLTDNVVVNVVKSPKWSTPSYDIVEDGQSLLAGLAAGNNVILNNDITFSQYVKIDKPVTLDLNGHNITWDKAEDGAFYVVEGGNLTISGEGTITAAKDEYATLVWVNGGEATIHNGTFVGSGEGQLIYCQKGTITIYGGTYNLIGTELNKVYFYPINCRDQEYDDGLAKIIVKGGIYYNFNPANNPAEGANTNFVADGYQSSEVTMANGETAWAVVPNGYSPAVQANQTILRTGGKVALAEDYNYVGSSDQAYLMINQNTEINLNGYTLSSSRNGAYNATLTVGGTGVQNVTISNGTILPLSDPASDEPALIFVRPVNNVQVTLTDVTAIGMHPVWMNANNGGQGSKITINSGTYNSQSATSPAVYVSAYNGVNDAGQIVINGGTFGQAGITNPYLLNVLDRLRADKDPREFIIVYGGTFINFNPADCVSEGVPTNFVAEGYTVTSYKVGNDTYYTVVKAN